jgi:amidase
MDATDLAFAGIARQAEAIAAGEVSSRELVELYLGRIERYNPQLNAFRIVFAQRALMEADQADARRRAGSTPSERPLLGVPIAVKDEFDVAGEVTTFGTNAYGEPAREDSEIVRRVRAAGAVIIGKTHMPELGAFPWTESPTWGATHNPWRLEHSPGGSSGGSAAAVAAGLVGAALAGDGGGSIRFPAAYCGLFGLKTQRGRVPLAPHLGAWHGLVVNGVLARSVRDTALFYDAIADGPSDPGAASVPPSSFLGLGSRPMNKHCPHLRMALRGVRCGSRWRASCHLRRSPSCTPRTAPRWMRR